MISTSDSPATERIEKVRLSKFLKELTPRLRTLAKLCVLLDVAKLKLDLLDPSLYYKIKHEILIPSPRGFPISLFLQIQTHVKYRTPAFHAGRLWLTTLQKGLVLP